MGILNSLVAVELRLCSDHLFISLHRQTNGIQSQIYRLVCCGFAGYDIVMETPDHEQVQHIFLVQFSMVGGTFVFYKRILRG